MTQPRRRASKSAPRASLAREAPASNNGGAPKTRWQRVASAYSLARAWSSRFMRMSLYFLVLLTAISAYLAHRARAHVGETLLGLGAAMMQYEAAETHDQPRLLEMNNERIYVATAFTRHSLERVLDHYQGKCREVGNDFGESVRALASSVPNAEQVGDMGMLDMTIRDEAGDAGYIACVDMGDRAVPLTELARRLQAFTETGDLHSLGDMRFVYAMRDRAASGTLIVTYWTEGSFRLLRMFPQSGDAPGADVRDVPRPPGGRRILTARESGQPQAMTMYIDSPTTPQALESHYRSVMPTSGWRLLELNARDSAEDPNRAVREAQHALVYEQGERMVTLVFVDTGDGKAATTVLVSR